MGLVIERGRVPLSFWLGPAQLLTLRIPVVIEDFRVVPGQARLEPATTSRELPRDVRGLYCRSLPVGDADAPVIANTVRYVLARYERRLISFKQTFDAYLERFSGKTRSTLRRKLRKFAEASGGNITWNVYRTPAEMLEFHKLGLEVSVRTYQARLFNAGLPDNPNFRAELQRLAEADQVRGFILFLHGVAISYLYCPASDDRLFYAKLGFRPEYAEHSPGTVLQFLALESLFAEQRFALFDFGEGGEGQHKRLFSTDSVRCANVLYLKSTPANLAIVAGHRGWSRLSSGIVAGIDRLGFKRSLRKRLRGQSLSPPPPAPEAARDQSE